MLKETGLEGLGRRRCSGTFQTILLLPLSEVSCLVFNFRDWLLQRLGLLCLPFSESSSPGMGDPPRLAAHAVALGVASGGAVPPLQGCFVWGKGFQETIDQMKPP